MAACVALPNDEFLSERYLDAFYEAHVASTRTRGNGALDEDIAAIEAEIRKVRQYQSKFRSYKLDHPHLNSCGNSECSDVDDQDIREDLSPTSVFRVYNSSGELGDPASPYLQHKSPDIFTWASAQQVQHDHGYCKGDSPCHASSSAPSPPDPPQTTTIDHGTVVVANIQWHKLTLSKRAHAVQKLSYILQHRPSGRQSPTFSSLDLLPSSLVNWIRKWNSLAVCSDPCPTPASNSSATLPSNSAPLSTPLPLSLPLLPTLACGPVHVNKLAQPKDFKFRGGVYKQQDHIGVIGKGSTGSGGLGRVREHRRKASPYHRLTRPVQVEVTRVRHISSCSEGDDHVVID